MNCIYKALTILSLFLLVPAQAVQPSLNKPAWAAMKGPERASLLGLYQYGLRGSGYLQRGYWQPIPHVKLLKDKPEPYVSFPYLPEKLKISEAKAHQYKQEKENYAANLRLGHEREMRSKQEKQKKLRASLAQEDTGLSKLKAELESMPVYKGIKTNEPIEQPQWEELELDPTID